MENVLPILGTVSLLSILPILIRLRRRIRETTLITAWNWTFASWIAWEFAWLLGFFPIEAGIQNHVWYLTAVLSLCPPIAVLGAKRPGSRVWAFFVLMPLVLVFSWPAWVEWVQHFPPNSLQLELPMQIAFGLVLVMGYGNYLGTRKSLTTLMIAFALGWLVSQFSGTPDSETPLQPIGPTLLIVFGSWVPLVIKARKVEEYDALNHVWQEFQEAFGIVWAKRVMDRVNFMAEQEQWSARLDIQGLIWMENPDPAQIQFTNERLDYTFRWLMRRFVDPEWLDERLPASPNANE